MALEPKFIELFIVEQAELRRQPTERPDKPELHGDVVNGVMGPAFSSHTKANSGFTFLLKQGYPPPQEDLYLDRCSYRPHREDRRSYWQRRRRASPSHGQP